MAVLGYLPKLKRGLRLAFDAYFLHDFSLLNTLSIDSFNAIHIFFHSRDIKQNVL